MGKKAKPRIWIGLRLCLFAGACVLLTQAVDISTLLHHMRGVPPQYILAAVVLQFTIRGLMAWQLQRTLSAYRTPFPLHKLFIINLVTAFYSLVLPGELASGGVGWQKLRAAGSEGTTALGAMVVTRLVNMVALFGIGISFWVRDTHTRQHPFGVLLFLMLLSAVAGYWFLIKKSWHLYELPMTRRLHPSLQRAVKALMELNRLSLRDSIVLFTLACAVHLVGIATHIVFAKAVHLHLSIWTLGWIRSTVLTLGMLPLSLSGMGLREGSLISLLYLYGASTEQAVTYSVLILMTTLGTALPGAGHEALSVWWQSVRVRTEQAGTEPTGHVQIT